MLRNSLSCCLFESKISSTYRSYSVKPRSALLDWLETTLRTVSCCSWANHMLSYVQIYWAACLSKTPLNQVCFSSCLLSAFPASFSGVCTAKIWKNWAVQKESFWCSYFEKFLIRMIGKASVIFFWPWECWENMNNLYSSCKLRQFWDCWACKKRGNSELSLLLAKWDETKEHLLLHGLSRQIFSRLLQHSDRILLCNSFCFESCPNPTKAEVSERKYWEGKEGNGNYLFSKLSFCRALWTTLHVLFKKKTKQTPKHT